jgi:NADH:ubiquinone oxidoreductase subunit C
VNIDHALNRAAELLAPWARASSRPEPDRLDVALAADDVIAAVRALRAGRWGYLAAITGLDHGGAASRSASELPGELPGELTGAVEVLYHFCAGAAIVTLRVQIPYSTPVVASICDLVPSAAFFERELSEMLGVTVTGTPDPSRLFLPDDWPDGVYPLRKEFAAGASTDPSAAASAHDPPEERSHADPGPA